MAENRSATLAGLVIAGLALIGSFFVPEVRSFLGLEPASSLQKEARSETASSRHVPEPRPESGSMSAAEVARVPPARPLSAEVPTTPQDSTNSPESPAIKTHLSAEKQQERAKSRVSKPSEAPVTPKVQVDTSSEQSRTRAEKDRVIGLWHNPRVDGGLLEIKKSSETAGYVAVQASDDSETSYRGEVVQEFAFNAAQGKFIGRHIIGGGKSTVRRWGEDGALKIEIIGPDSLDIYYLDSIYKGGWTFRRITEHEAKLLAKGQG